jgi:hypothetical protein
MVAIVAIVVMVAMVAIASIGTIATNTSSSIVNNYTAIVIYIFYTIIICRKRTLTTYCIIVVTVICGNTFIVMHNIFSNIVYISIVVLWIIFVNFHYFLLLYKNI